MAKELQWLAKEIVAGLNIKTLYEMRRLAESGNDVQQEFLQHLVEQTRTRWENEKA